MNTAKSIIKCVCGCDHLSKSDIDRFTDRIENVLGNPQGREVFKRYMEASHLKDGIKCLEFYECLDTTISKDKKCIMESLEEIMDRADNIDELDFAMMEKLTISIEENKWDDVVTMLNLIKGDAVKIMSRDYNIFKDYLLSKVK